MGMGLDVTLAQLVFLVLLALAVGLLLGWRSGGVQLDARRARLAGQLRRAQDTIRRLTREISSTQPKDTDTLVEHDEAQTSLAMRVSALRANIEPLEALQAELAEARSASMAQDAEIFAMQQAMQDLQRRLQKDTESVLLMRDTLASREAKIAALENELATRQLPREQQSLPDVLDGKQEEPCTTDKNPPWVPVRAMRNARNPDDLTQLRNLSERDQHRLNWLGIYSFVQLADLDEQKRQWLHQALRMNNCALLDDWVHQARAQQGDSSPPVLRDQY